MELQKHPVCKVTGAQNFFQNSQANIARPVTLLKNKVSRGRVVCFCDWSRPHKSGA
jgi:hypothetical protein